MKYSLVKLNNNLSNNLSKFSLFILKGILDCNEKTDQQKLVLFIEVLGGICKSYYDSFIDALTNNSNEFYMETSIIEAGVKILKHIDTLEKTTSLK